MITTIKKWQITVVFDNNTKLTFYYSDNFLGNVLRQLALIDYVDKPTEIEIKEIKEINYQYNQLNSSFQVGENK